MNFLGHLILGLFAAQSFAAETSYFYCSSRAPDFQRLFVKQVITSEDGTVWSTFKIDAYNELEDLTTYWQESEILFSGDELKGVFKADDKLIDVDIKAPTYPDYKPRKSTISDGIFVHEMNCNTP